MQGIVRQARFKILAQGDVVSIEQQRADGVILSQIAEGSGHPPPLLLVAEQSTIRQRNHRPGAPRQQAVNTRPNRPNIIGMQP